MKTVKMHKSVIEPFLLEDQNDFQKMYLWLVQSAQMPDEFKTMYTDLLKIMLHDYTALVLSDKIDPYLFDDDISTLDDTYKAEFMALINQFMLKWGVPLKEQKGKMVIDPSQLSKKSK